jgi:putative addiction module killer protein
MDGNPPYEVVPYRRRDGSSPFEDWFEILRVQDRKATAKITQRLARLKWGHLGSYDNVGEGVLELIDPYGPGYRIYITRSGRTIYLLLVGGTKRTQRSDIERAIDLKNEAEEDAS